MTPETRRDWDYSNSFLPEAFNVLRQNASFLVQFEIAPTNVDLKEVGDIVLSSNMGHIAFRVRRPNVTWRDLTIRCRRSSGAETEIHKIRRGFCRWYLYAWADGEMPNGNGRFKEWILVDVDQFRQCGLAFEDREEEENKDGRTWFYVYSDDELELYQCIVAKSNARIQRNKWLTWNQVNKKYPNCDLVPISIEVVRPGDIYEFETILLNEIIEVQGHLVSIGEARWVSLSPQVGNVKVYRPIEQVASTPNGNQPIGDSLVGELRQK